MPETIDVSLPLSQITQIGFLVIFAIFIIFSAILYYHWQEYSVDAKVTRLTLILYFSTTTPLVLMLGILTLII